MTIQLLFSKIYFNLFMKKYYLIILIIDIDLF